MSHEIINLTHNNYPKKDFKLRYISISKYEGDWQSLPHTHQFSELFYVLSGKGAFYVENNVIPVKTDDLIIINPHVEHTEKTLPNNPMDYIVFGIEGLTFSFLQNNEDSSKNYSYYNYGAVKHHFINFSQLIAKEFHEKKPGFELVCHDILEILLTYISREQNISVILDSMFQTSKECALAKRYIDENYSQNITLDLLANITHIDKFYLTHTFTKCLGQSPIRYLTEKRLSSAKELLAGSNFSISQISSMTGFSSQSYFAQIFRKEVGLTPLQYRKSHNKN